jgi:DNA-binding beta-propeller fold protein YncE
MNYGGGVFRDESTGLTHYGGYASMLVLIDGCDPQGARVLPAFDGLLPGSPPCGPLLEIGGKRYDVFLTFGAVGPGAVLQVGDRLSLAGVVWPPVSGHVEGEIVKPSGERSEFRTPAGPMGVFDFAGPTVDEPGIWRVAAEGVCSGKTSAGTISSLIPEEDWPRGGGLGLSTPTFDIPVVPESSPTIAFDLPPGARAHPPSPLILRGCLPHGTDTSDVNVLVSLPGQVVDRRVLPAKNGAFEYVYDPRRLRASFPNIDTKVGVPQGGFEGAPAWFDTVTFTFWAGHEADITAGMVLLQGEWLYDQTDTGRRLPRDRVRKTFLQAEPDRTPKAPADGTGPPRAASSPEPTSPGAPAAVARVHSSLLALSPDRRRLFAVHPWSGEVVRLDVSEESPRVSATARVGGEPRSVALGPDERRLYIALAEKREVLSLDAHSLETLRRFPVAGEPRAALPSADERGLFVADFDRDCVVRLGAATGAVEAASDPIDRPACLALDADRGWLYTVSFRTGEVVVLDERCHVLRRLAAPAQLNQCRSVTIGPDGRLYAPQTRSDTVVGGRMFDRSVFPAVAVGDPRAGRVRIEHFPDLLVTPPHRPAEVAVDARALYLASAGSDDVLAIDRRTGWAEWHSRGIGREPGAITLDTARDRLYVLTITGQEIIALDAVTGKVLARTRFADDPTPSRIARGRYLFGTATDKRLTKDQWMSCAVCHPSGEEDGRQWDLGKGRFDTRSLRGCLEAGPLHFDAHLDEIQDTYDFTRIVMAGQWFVSPNRMHPPLGEPNAGLDSDLDALAAYVASLAPREPPAPPPGAAALRVRGKAIFFSDEAGCADCHPAPLFTDSGKRGPDGRYVLHDVGTHLACEPEALRRLDTPSLLGLHRSAPYLHDGRAKTLEEVFSTFNPNDRHGRTSHLSREEIHALCEFLRYLRPHEEP